MRIISSDDAPSNMRRLALKAASNFSATINLASRRALLSPRINFINRKPITRLASTPNIIHGWNIVFPRTTLSADCCSTERSSGDQARIESADNEHLTHGPRNAFAANIKCHAPILFLGYESELRRAGVSAAGAAHSIGVGW
jgi:hypothetical protein